MSMSTEKCDAILVITVESPLWPPRVHALHGHRDVILAHAKTLYEAAEYDERAGGGCNHAVAVFTTPPFEAYAWENRSERFVPIKEAYGV